LKDYLCKDVYIIAYVFMQQTRLKNVITISDSIFMIHVKFDKNNAF